MSTAINHVNIVVKDLDAARNFFCEMLGFTAGPPTLLDAPWVSEITGYKDASATFIPLSAPAGDCHIELLTYHVPASPPPPDGISDLNHIGYRHIGLEVDNIDKLYAELYPCCKFFSPPVTATGMGVKTVYFVGPEGVIIQLTEKLAS